MREAFIELFREIQEEGRAFVTPWFLRSINHSIELLSLSMRTSWRWDEERGEYELWREKQVPSPALPLDSGAASS